jgi:hypothetical protein
MHTIDVDIDDFLSSCRKRDIEAVIEFLIEEGYINKKHTLDPSALIGAAESDYENNLSKLHNKWNLLTTEEEEAIKQIANRF